MLCMHAIAPCRMFKRGGGGTCPGIFVNLSRDQTSLGWQVLRGGRQPLEHNKEPEDKTVQITEV